MSRNQKVQSDAYLDPRSQSIQHLRVESIKLCWPVEDESPYGEVFFKFDKRLEFTIQSQNKDRVGQRCSDLFLDFGRRRRGGHMPCENASPPSCSEGPSGHSR